MIVQSLTSKVQGPRRNLTSDLDNALPLAEPFEQGHGDRQSLCPATVTDGCQQDQPGHGKHHDPDFQDRIASQFAQLF